MGWPSSGVLNRTKNYCYCKHYKAENRNVNLLNVTVKNIQEEKQQHLMEVVETPIVY
jgi:hypothetical protein